MSAGAERPPAVDVAVAVVQRADGRVLLAERPRGKVSAGYWELPGGKFKAGETPEQALARELHEELGIELDTAHPWMIYEHGYPKKRVRLHFYRVTAWHGTPHGREGQRIAWQDPEAPAVSPLLPANDKVLRALRLPPLYAIADARKAGPEGFPAVVDAALARGVRLIQVRASALAPEQLAQCARRVVARARAHGAAVLVNGEETLARKTGAGGVHSPAAELMRLAVRPGVRLWAVSCHNARELARAAALGADFVVLSPVLPSATHPGEPGMGWERFAQLVRACPLPVYALGGMRAELLETAQRHGAHGIALASGLGSLAA